MRLPRAHTIFEHIGAAPRQLVFDNATGVGRRTGTKVVEWKLFAAFKLHYRAQERYCNPNSGHEKGNVENAVGFLRRNLMVPEPQAATLAGLNQLLLALCQEMDEAEHWRKGVPISELFTQDLTASLEFPGVEFDPVRYEQRRVDKTGNLLVEGNTYAAGPSFGSQTVTVGLRHDTIEILDEIAAPVVVFDRVFGRGTATVIDPARIVPLLAAKPGAWSHSPLRSRVADPLRDWACSPAGSPRANRCPSPRSTCGFMTPWSPSRGRAHERNGGCEGHHRVGRAASLTTTVLAEWAEKGTPKQRKYLLELLMAEHEFRQQARRKRLLRAARLPALKSLAGYDWTAARFPEDYGREALTGLDSIDRAEDLVLYGDVGTG